MSAHSRCRGCDASMIWAVTINGRPQPFDVEPSEKGTVLLVHKEAGKPPIANVVTSNERLKL